MWFRDALREFFHKADLLLLSLCVIASLFGVVLIYSATRWMGAASARDRFVPIQLIAIFLGIIVYIVMSFVDIELFTERSWKWMVLFNVVIILLLLTPFGVGKEETGNNSWLDFPFLPVNIQPAEVAKIFFILLLAWQCAKYQDWGISHPSSVFLLAGHTLFMAGLIAWVSGDFGMVLVYLFLFVLMAWTAGVKKRWFLLGGAGAVGGLALIWPHLPSYITLRFTVVVDHLLGSQSPTAFTSRRWTRGGSRPAASWPSAAAASRGRAISRAPKPRAPPRRACPPGTPTRFLPYAARSWVWWAACLSCCS